WAGEVENFFHFDQLAHDFGLIHISRNPVEHENVDVRLELVGVDRGIDRFFPKFDRNVVRNELAFAGVFEKRFTDFAAGVDGAKHVSAWAMKKSRDRAKRLALSPFAAPRRAK